MSTALAPRRHCAGDDVAHAVGKDSMGEYRRGAGAVAYHVAGLLRLLSKHPGAKVLLRILEIEFSLAMVTPSLHTTGAPHFFSISTDFDRGPKVTRTASAS
jgi:hypothetical protein